MGMRRGQVGGLMLAGLLLKTSPNLIPALASYWWVVLSAGVLLFTFSLN